ncbi:LysM domain-containing protein [Leifsonia sp. NPDC080035]|uniref:LysM domain-containing protein n=1 Tax=Leifsonia sp. NPDC080035 TaxID=3143936 RepID=A0AAU7GF95_9MICO
MTVRRIAGAAAASALVLALAGCALFGGGGPAAKPTRTATPTPTATAAPADATRTTGTATPSASPTPPPPPPTLTPVPQGTVVAEGDVASPKGSIHYHYRVVANGDNTYTAQFTRFTSTVPVPISATFLEIAPSVGDGLTYHGVGDHQLGGPTTSPASSSGTLGTESQPSYLAALVTYSSAPSATGVPVELGPGKVLAVDTVHWSVPVRQSNVHPVDHGAAANAGGTVTATTASGAPKRYKVAPGDTTDAVAQRFGITVQDLIWLNAENGTLGAGQTLYATTLLNLDPDSL